MSKVRLSVRHMQQFWDASTDMYLVPVQVLQDALNLYTTDQPYTQVLNEAGKRIDIDNASHSPFLDMLTTNTTNIGGAMPAGSEKVSYGRLVRVPNDRGNGYADVTVKTAKAEAKRLRKLAKQIEKACR